MRYDERSGQAENGRENELPEQGVKIVQLVGGIEDYRAEIREPHEKDESEENKRRVAFDLEKRLIEARGRQRGDDIVAVETGQRQQVKVSEDYRVKRRVHKDLTKNGENAERRFIS